MREGYEDEVPVVAIDGPGGAGKGTVSLLVAERLGWRMLDSGALYRLVALQALEDGVDPNNEVVLARHAGTLDVEFATAGRESRAYLSGRDVTDAIRAEACSAAASRIAALPAVRAALAKRQRDFRRPPGLVADGRDMGSVIFPDARLKVFLTASVDERARRRYNQLIEKGIDVSLPALSREMSDRDRRDAERSVAPLKPCQDARVLDTTGMSVAEVVSTVLGWVKETYPEFVNM